MILYKYTSLSNALNILLTQQIRYTQPIAFNDPFEISPIAKTKIKVDFIKEHIGIILGSKDLMDYAYDKTFKVEYDNLNDNLKSIFPYELYSNIQKTRIENEIKNRNKSFEDVLLEKIKELYPDFTEFFFKALPLAIGSRIGILSLSKIDDNILMWSHYSNCHLGAIIAIDTDNQFFSNLEKVIYDDKRPSIDVNINSSSEREEVDFAKMIFYSKSTSWGYEEEYRDLKLLDGGTLSDTTDGNGYRLCLFKLPKGSIKGLTFGAKLTSEEKKYFLSNLGTLEYEIEIREAKLNNFYFSLDINPFNDLN